MFKVGDKIALRSSPEKLFGVVTKVYPAGTHPNTPSEVVGVVHQNGRGCEYRASPYVKMDAGIGGWLKKMDTEFKERNVVGHGAGNSSTTT